jgi:imidazolonepropionase-like amidohydrolase
VFVVPTLATYDALAEHGAALGFPKVSLDKLESVRSAGVAALQTLDRAGVKIGFGTDLLGSMHQHQLSEFQIRAQVLPPAQILRQATSINAQLLQREGELGVVAAGALADLLVIDGDPVRDLNLLSGDGSAVCMVVLAGEVVKDTR